METLDFRCNYNNIHYLGFNGISDIMDTAKSICRGKTKMANGFNLFGKTYDFKDFVGTDLNNVLDYENISTALNLNIEDFENDADKFLDTDNNHSYTYDVTGLNYDTGLLLDGTPEMWITESAMEEKPIIRLYFDLSVTADTEFKDIEKRSIGQFSIALWFVKNQYPVELHFTRTIWNSKCKAHKDNIIDVNAGMINDIPINHLIYSLSSACLYRGIMLFVCNMILFKKYTAGCTPLSTLYTRDYIRQLDIEKNTSMDYVNVLLTSYINAYSKESISDFLDKNEFVKGEYLIFD